MDSENGTLGFPMGEVYNTERKKGRGKYRDKIEQYQIMYQKRHQFSVMMTDMRACA